MKAACPAKGALGASRWMSRTPASALASASQSFPAFDATNCCRDRYDLLDALANQGFHGWGIELGVASGNYSLEMLRRTGLTKVISVDMWANDRGHDDAQRNGARAMLQPFGSRSCTLWGKFEDILPAFGDNLFDLVYVDGYAHTGEAGGGTIVDWWPKVRPGGVFGGHDYSTEWPKVQAAVDGFTATKGLLVHTIGPASKETEPAAENDCCASWFVVKPLK